MKRDAVVLAAGFSSRTGTNKMALVIENKTILARVIETLLSVCDEIVVVGGHNFETIKQITDEFDRVTLVKNDAYSLGMFSSVIRGTREMKKDFFLIPGDCPAVKITTYQMLLKSPGNFIVPVFNKKGGHPVLIKKELIPKLLDEPMESNLKAFRNKCNPRFVEVNDEGILLDIDTPEDFKYIKEIVERRSCSEN